VCCILDKTPVPPLTVKAVFVQSPFNKLKAVVAVKTNVPVVEPLKIGIDGVNTRLSPVVKPKVFVKFTVIFSDTAESATAVYVALVLPSVTLIVTAYVV